MYQGISLQSAPPFGVVCAFFINASAYLIVAGVLFATQNVALNAYSQQLIALTHCLGVGFFALTMFGALSQMLPVLANIRLKAPKLTCTLTLLFTNVGVIAFLAAFLGFFDEILPLNSAFASAGGFFLVAMIALGLGVGGFGLVVLAQMLAIRHFNATTLYMFAALIALLVGVIFAQWLLAGFVGFAPSANRLVLVLCHLSLMLFGWIMLLIIGVILQVLPMFYVAPSFEKSFFTRIVPLLFAALLGFLGLLYFTELEFTDFLPLFFAAIALVVSFHALKTLKNRRRKLFDSTMFLWFFAFANLAFSGVFFALSLANAIFMSLAALCFAFGFVCCIIFAMFYKIIPFLTWFHLSYAGVLSLPNMRLIVPPLLIKAQICAFLLGFFLFATQTLLTHFEGEFSGILSIFSGLQISNFINFLNSLCGLCFVCSGFLLIIAILKAYKIYLAGMKSAKF